MQGLLPPRGQLHRWALSWLGATLLLAPMLHADPPRPPNILLILCDDLGADDLGSAGNAWSRTPHLDALAAGSVRFSDFTVNPVCAPSRATLLTGRHFLRTGVAHVHGGKDYVHRDEILLPQRLRAAGYATGMWGKWHNGTTEGYLPWQRGFDEVYMADLYRHRATTGLVQDGSRVAHPGWADAVLVDYTIDFMRRHRDRPFFAFLPTMTPHGRHDAPEELVATYQARGLGDGPARLFAMVEFLDSQVGRLFAALESEGLADDTLVLFLSDNGPNHDGHFSPAERELRRVRGLRGWKGDIWEGGVRSPLFVRWPRRFSPRAVATPVQLADLFPTLCAAAGISLDAHPSRLDGADLLPLLTQTGPYPTRPIFNYANPGWPPSDQPYSPMGIRDEYHPVAPEDKPALEARRQVISLREDSFKLLLNADLNVRRVEDPWDDFTLVHLAADPTETRDVKELFPEEFSRLRSTLLTHFDAMKQEPHSFTAPRFLLTACQPLQLRLPAAAPTRLSPGLRNTVNRLHGWTTRGQFADYHLELTRPLHLTVTPRWQDPFESSACRIIVLPDTGPAENATITSSVPVGPGFVTLRLQLDSDLPVPAALEALTLDVKPESPLAPSPSGR